MKGPAKHTRKRCEQETPETRKRRSDQRQRSIEKGRKGSKPVQSQLKTEKAHPHQDQIDQGEREERNTQEKIQDQSMATIPMANVSRTKQEKNKVTEIGSLENGTNQC